MAYTPGQFITQTDVDDLATLASDKCVPQIMDTPTDTPVTYDAATFSFETLAGANPAAWITEINRIWYSLFDPDQNASPSQATYDLTYSGVQSFTTIDRIGGVLRYWETDKETVVSCGPHLWSYCRSVTSYSTYWQCKAFQEAKFIFSRIDCPDFYLRPGFILGTIEEPTEMMSSGGAGSSANPKYVDIDYSLPPAWLYGDAYAEFIAPSPGAGAGPPASSDIGFSGWGSGGSGTWEFVSGSTWRLHLGYQGIKNTIDNSGGGGSGTFRLSAYVDDAGWNFHTFGFIGVIQTETELQASVDAVNTTHTVVSPRNAAMRDKVHVTFDPHFRTVADGYHDIVNADAFITKLHAAGTMPPTANPQSTYIYAVIGEPLETWIDDYPGGANDTLIEPALIPVLNDLIDGPNLHDTGYWDGVSLREATAWLLARNPTGQFLQILNRLLLEDAYPDELLRIPEASFDIDEEIGELAVPDVDAYRVESIGYYFGLFQAGAFCTLVADEDENPVPRVAGVYVAKAWPQAFHHTYLDYDLPNYWPYAKTELSALRDGGNVYGVGSDVTPIGTVFPMAGSLPAAWPVVDISKFSGYRLGTSNSVTGDCSTAMNVICPYWASDIHHVWNDQGFANIAAGDLVSYSSFISDTLGDTMLEKRTLEWSANNSALHIYVSATGIPDPLDAGTYLFVKTDGTLKFPSDFTDNSLTPSDYYGGNLYFAIYNPTAGVLTSHFVFSEFYSSEGEEPPFAEPLFFPRRNLTGDDRYEMKLEESTYVSELVSDNSYRFTPLEYAPLWGGSTQRAMPIPDRGYCITGLIIRNKSTNNAAGIKVAPSSDSQVTIGVMAGAGVFAGAIWGSYPGEFLEFATYTLSGGQTERYIEVFWPVLAGCPLASRSDVGEHTITALVDFQPGVNVGFRGRVADSEQQGSYSGKPYFQGRYFIAQNFNNPSVTSYEWLLLPPVSARSFTDLNYLLLVMPDI